jgi:pyridoxal phosphate enzyme (YggS family)
MENRRLFVTIESNLTILLNQIAFYAKKAGRKKEDISLVAVSKNCSVNAIQEAFQLGCKDFGESRVQEALKKMEEISEKIHWHYIGKLQSNKISKIVGNFELIHSVDSFAIAKKISEVSESKRHLSRVLIEVNTSGEETKGGMTVTEAKELFPLLLGLKSINVLGFMTMAPLAEEEAIIRRCFSELRHLKEEMEDHYGQEFPILSMGMSHDFPIAIQEGSTLLRIGTALFNSL